MGQLDMFGVASAYPHSAGHRGVDTSIEAASKVDARKSRKKKCYEDIIEHLRKCGAFGATTHELAYALKQYDYEYLQPRTSELSRPEIGRISYSGKRRMNSKGSSERVWVIANS